MISLRDLKPSLQKGSEATEKATRLLLGTGEDAMNSPAAYTPFKGTEKFDPPMWAQSEKERITSAVRRIQLEHPHWECSICHDDLRKGSIRSKDVYYCFPCWDEFILKVKQQKDEKIAEIASRQSPDAHLGGVEL